MAVANNDLVVGPVIPALGVTVISLDFYFELEEWLDVYKSGSETPLILNTDYTTTGEGTGTGAITLAVAADGVDSYSVYLNVPLQRSSDLQTRGEFKSGPFNLELDRVWQAMQGISTRLGRALSVSRTSASVDVLFSDDASLRAGNSLAFSGDGTALVIGPSIADVLAVAPAAAAALASENAAAASAAAALASESAAALSEAAADADAIATAADAAATAADRVQTGLDVAATALVYLGVKSADPTTDNEGNPLLLGAQYFNDVTNTVRVFNGIAFIELVGGGGKFYGNAGTVGTASGDIFRANAKTLTVSATIGATENASAAGPLTIDTGVTLTVTSGGSLVIV